MKWTLSNLPTFADSREAVKVTHDATPVHRLIYWFEPAGPLGETFRQHLVDALNHAAVKEPAQ